MTDTRTAAALVDAGRELFGRRGFDGTSVRSLTRQAGANLGAVTYHFGSKEALYRAVLARCLEPLAAGLAEVAAQPGPALERLEWSVRLCLDYLSENPGVPRLLLRELLRDRATGEDVDEPLEEIRDTLGAVIREGQEAGTIRPGDPGLLATSVLAQPLHFSLYDPGPSEAGGTGAAPSSGDVADHAVDFVLAGLRPDATARGRRRRR